MAEDLLISARSMQSEIRIRSRERLILRPLDVLLPLAIACWGLGVSQTDTTHLGQFGLPAALPIVFYVGVGLLVISIGWALALAQPSPIRLSAHLGTLILMLYGTAPLVYEAARYSWLYKYIGVVQYINLHGHLNQTVDIYQNWPGFFAFTAWFDRVVGVQSPIAYAKWAQLVFELLTCLMLSFVFRALPLTFRERWLALFLYAASIWIAQDYLSAQALGVILSTGIFALVMNYMYQDDETRWIAWFRKRLQPLGNLVRRTSAYSDESGALANQKTTARQDAAVLGAIFVIYFVLVFEHELSPYVVLIQLTALAVIGRLRHRWFVIVLAVLALSYLAPHFVYVNSHFGLVGSIGNFFGNTAPPSATLGSATRGVSVAEEAARLLSVAMWGLSAIGAWRRWRSRRPTLPLMILAYSPVLVFFAGAYGNEGLLRVYLFSLPWTVCLAASAVKPVATSQSRLGILRAPAVLACAVILFFPAFFGDDAFYIMTPGEVNGVLSFFRSAPPGTVYTPDSDWPGNITGRYNEFGGAELAGPGGLLTGKQLGTLSGTELTRAIEHSHPNPDEPVYVLITKSMLQFGLAYGFLQPHDLEKLSNTLNNAPGWFQLYNSNGVTVYELPPSS